MIGGREDLQCSSAREDGHISALRRAGIPVDPALMVPGEFTVQTIELGAAPVVRGSMAVSAKG
jgi:LacI family transcriptional regulator